MFALSSRDATLRNVTSVPVEIGVLIGTASRHKFRRFEMAPEEEGHKAAIGVVLEQ